MPPDFLLHKNGNEIGFCPFFLGNCLILDVAARGFSVIVMSGSYSPVQCAGFSLHWLLWSAVCRLLTPLASLVTEHRLAGMQASVVEACGL